MTDVWGNPEPHRIYIPGPAHRAAPSRPPGNDPTLAPMAMLVTYGLAAALYVLGFLPAFPRSHQHDLWLAAGLIPALMLGHFLPSLKRLPLIGPALARLLIVTLAFSPFVLDFWLMAGK